MNFTWDISFGQLVLGIPLITLAVYMLRIHKALLLFRLEHEILMKDWSERAKIKLSEIPTRQKGWL